MYHRNNKLIILVFPLVHASKVFICIPLIELHLKLMSRFFFPRHSLNITLVFLHPCNELGSTKEDFCIKIKKEEIILWNAYMYTSLRVKQDFCNNEGKFITKFQCTMLSFWWKLGWSCHPCYLYNCFAIKLYILLINICMHILWITPQDFSIMFFFFKIYFYDNVVLKLLYQMTSGFINAGVQVFHEHSYWISGQAL